MSKSLKCRKCSGNHVTLKCGKKKDNSFTKVNSKKRNFVKKTRNYRNNYDKGDVTKVKMSYLPHDMTYRELRDLIQKDEWGKVACKGCKCGFKCPKISTIYDGSTQLPTGSESLNIDDVNWEIGRKYPKPCVSGEYCPGNKNRNNNGIIELRPRLEEDALSTSDKYNAIDPHYYPQNDGTQFSCLGCTSEVAASSEYCKKKGDCEICPCPKGHYCPDKTTPKKVGGTGNSCDCPDGHNYSLNSIENQRSLMLIGENGISKSKELKGAGQEIRCCAEGQCCDVSISECKGDGRRTDGFAWPVSSPIGYQSHCLPNGMGTNTYPSPSADLSVPSGICPQDTFKCTDSEEIVPRNPDDNCNFKPCSVIVDSPIGSKEPVLKNPEGTSFFTTA